jgi:DNA invertase Pin-like site-specific DNA recombinase
MIYAYMRVSTAHQTLENQHYELLKFADQRSLRVESWITETVSGAKAYPDRVLGELLERLTPTIPCLSRNSAAWGGVC